MYKLTNKVMVPQSRLWNHTSIGLYKLFKKALQFWGLCANKPEVITQDQLYMKVNREENMQILGFYTRSV